MKSLSIKFSYERYQSGRSISLSSSCSLQPGQCWRSGLVITRIHSPSSSCVRQCSVDDDDDDVALQTLIVISSESPAVSSFIVQLETFSFNTRAVIFTQLRDTSAPLYSSNIWAKYSHTQVQQYYLKNNIFTFLFMWSSSTIFNLDFTFLIFSLKASW